MDLVWLILAFSIGGSLGFLLFALLQSLRGPTRQPKAKFKAVLHSLEFEGETVTRF